MQGAWNERFGMAPETYLLAVEEGGGAPMLLPPQPFDAVTIDRVLGAIDGLVLSGGADVDPARYGAEPDPRTQAPRHDRDAWEIALVSEALERDLPVLAICRGVQVLNVALGGTLTQHVPDITDTDHGDAPGAYARVDVAIVGGTRTGEVLGERLSVDCHHHQVIDRVADGLLVSGRSADGLIHSVEIPGVRFALGVQWHPEQDATDRRLFEALSTAAGATR